MGAAVEQGRGSKRGAAPTIALSALTVVLVCLLSAAGQGPDTGAGAATAGVLTAVSIILHSGLYALAYLAGAIGLGRLPAAVIARNSRSRMAVQAALGVGMMLWLSHLLGCAGMLSGDGMGPRVVAWAVVGIGLVLLLDQMARGDLMPEKWPTLPWAAVFAAPALAVLLVASANPPGWLWGSEFGAYDALSYHIQLPKEWAVGGLAPSEHNVYSFLPGYVEAGFLHLGQMVLGNEGDVTRRMLGGDGTWVYSCQLLHALLAALGALVCGRGAWAAALRCGANGGVAMLAGCAGSIVTLSTGWTLVCGSLAYNEMAVVLLSAGAMLLCVDRSGSPEGGQSADARSETWLRCAGIGLLVGLASSCKPTALLLVGPAAGMLMLGTLQRGRWLGAIVAGSIGGVIAIAPWLVRNAIAAGNPVFPFAAETLGLGHWTAEQVARHAKAHGFDGSIFARGALLFSQRGWMHAQWGAMPWLALAAAIGGIAWGDRGRHEVRRLTILLCSGLVCGLIAWMFFTHLQSRFLVPLMPLMIMLIGVGIAAAAARAAPPKTPTQQRSMRAGAMAYGAIALIVCLPWVSVMLFLAERSGAPNALLVGGVPEFTGAHRMENVYLDLSPQRRAGVLREATGPFELINLAVQPALLGAETRAALLGENQDLSSGEPAAVYLLGDATPLYYFGATGGPDAGVVYHTTWDASPLGDAIRAGASDPSSWTAALRRRGIGFVLINFDELDRLCRRDGYFDPAVTVELVDRWMNEPSGGCAIIRAWWAGGITHPGSPGERPGRVLVRLVGQEGTGSTGKR